MAIQAVFEVPRGCGLRNESSAPWIAWYAILIVALDKATVCNLQGRSMRRSGSVEGLCSRFACRDGGTGRRSGLKIRRSLRSWGFDPPSRHHRINHLARFGDGSLFVDSPAVPNFVPTPPFLVASSVFSRRLSCDRTALAKMPSIVSPWGWTYRWIIVMLLCPAVRARANTSPLVAFASRVRAVCRRT